MSNDIVEFNLEEVSKLVTIGRNSSGELYLVAVHGHVEGDVEGSVLGSVCGDVFGNVEGYVGGEVEGDVFGDVGGDVEGRGKGAVYGGVGKALTSLSLAELKKGEEL
jgi:hypothetical protein